jgi:hypothetical protein
VPVEEEELQDQFCLMDLMLFILKAIQDREIPHLLP